MCVEGGGGKVVLEEILWQLEILLGGSNKAGLLKIWMIVHRTRSGDNNRVL